MNTLENRIRALEDRVALSELRSKYAWFTTRGDRDAVLALFTADGVFENHRAPGGEPALARGQAEMAHYFRHMAPGRRVPMVMNEVFQIGTDTAEGTCVMTAPGDDGFCGHYIDSFRREGEHWLFSHRRFFPYWPVFAPSAERTAP